MTPTDQDEELRALLDEFVLYMDSNPESNEPTELKLFLEQCGFPDAIDRLYGELVPLITADRKRVESEARIEEHISYKNTLLSVIELYPTDNDWARGRKQGIQDCIDDQDEYTAALTNQLNQMKGDS